MGIKTTNFDVPMIEFSRKVGHYRYFVRDMKSPRNPGVSYMTKKNCSWNQIKLVIPFEKEGTETKGFYKTKGSKHWVDTSAPDIHLDNASMAISFFISFRNGFLDYSVNTHFTASVKTKYRIAGSLMSAFEKHWKSDVRNKVSLRLKQILSTGEIKIGIREALELLLRDALGLNPDTRIYSIRFTQNEIISACY